MAACPFALAKCRGVSPSEETASTLAFSCRSILATSMWPALAAQCSAVYPSEPASFKMAKRWVNTSYALARLPLLQASWKSSSCPEAPSPSADDMSVCMVEE